MSKLLEVSTNKNAFPTFIIDSHYQQPMTQTNGIFVPPLTSAGLYRPPAPTGFGIPEVIEVRRSFGGEVDMAVE